MNQYSARLKLSVSILLMLSFVMNSFQNLSKMKFVKNIQTTFLCCQFRKMSVGTFVSLIVEQCIFL